MWEDYPKYKVKTNGPFTDNVTDKIQTFCICAFLRFFGVLFGFFLSNSVYLCEVNKQTNKQTFTVEMYNRRDVSQRGSIVDSLLSSMDRQYLFSSLHSGPSSFPISIPILLSTCSWTLPMLEASKMLPKYPFSVHVKYRFERESLTSVTWSLERQMDRSDRVVQDCAKLPTVLSRSFLLFLPQLNRLSTVQSE